MPKRNNTDRVLRRLIGLAPSDFDMMYGGGANILQRLRSR